MEKKIKTAYDTLEKINNWIFNSESKASILIAVLGIIVGFTTDVFSCLTNLKNIIEGNLSCNIYNIIIISIQLILLLAYIISLIFSAFNIFKTLLPIIANDSFKGNELERHSIIFFGSIAKNSTFDDFKNKLNSLNDEKLLNDINSQVYINSCICNLKFFHLKKAVKWVFISGAFILLLLISINLL